MTKKDIYKRIEELLAESGEKPRIEYGYEIQYTDLHWFSMHL